MPGRADERRLAGAGQLGVDDRADDEEAIVGAVGGLILRERGCRMPAGEPSEGHERAALVRSRGALQLRRSTAAHRTSSPSAVRAVMMTRSAVWA